MAGRDPLNSFTDLAALQAEADRVIAIVRSVDEAVKNVGQITSLYKGSAGNAELKKNTEELSTANQNLLTIQKQLDQETQKSVTLQSELAKQIAITREQNKQKTKDITAEARETAGLNDAYKKLELQYAAASREAKNLAITQGANSEEAKNAALVAKQLSDQLKTIDSSVGQNQRKVGDYTGALKTLEGELQRVREELTKTKTAQSSLIAGGPSIPSADQNRRAIGAPRTPNPGDIQAVSNYNAQLEKTSATVAELERQEELLNTIMSNQAHGFSSINQEIRSNERALQTLRAANLEDSKAFKDLRMRVVELHKELNEFNNQQKLLESHAPGLKALTVAAKGLGGAYALSAGAAALFGDEQGKIEKETQKLIAIMTVLQGLNEIAELLQQRKAVGLALETSLTKAAAFAQRIYTMAMTESTAAAQLLRVALIGTGIGAIILLLTSFTTSMNEVAEATEKDLEAQKKLNEALKTYDELLVKNNEELSKTLEENTQLLKDQLQIQEALGANDYVRLGLKKQIAEGDKKNALDALHDLGLNTTGVDVLASKYDQIKAKIFALQEAKVQILPDHQIGIDEVMKKLPQIEAVAKRVGVNPKELAKDWDKVVESLNNQAEATQSVVNRGRALVKQYQDADQALKVLNVEQNKFAVEDFSKAGFADRKRNLEDAIRTAKKISEIEALSLNIRLRARQNEFQLEEKLIIAQRNFDLENNSLTELQRIEIKKAANHAIKDEQLLLVADLFKIEGNYKAKLREEEKQITDMFVEESLKREKQIADALKVTNERRVANIEEARDILITALDKTYAEGKITEQQYQDQRKKLETDADVFILKARQDLVKLDIDKAKAEGKDPTILEAQYANLEKQINDKKNQSKIDSDKKVFEEKKKLKGEEIELEKKAAEQFGATVEAFVKGAYERQLNSLQDQIDANTKLKDTEITRINQSSLSEQDKAAKLTQINAQTQANNERLAARQKEIKLKEAKFERDTAILNVGIATGQAVAKTLLEAHVLAANPLTAALAPAAYAQVPIEIGIGAAQIAAILAKPLPRYATGTDYSPEGHAIVGEKGHELRIDPSGQISLTPDKPSLTYLQQGTKIIPHDEVNKMMLGMMMQNTAMLMLPKKQDEAAKEIRSMKQIIQWQHQELIQAWARIAEKNRPIIKKDYKDFGKDYI